MRTSCIERYYIGFGLKGPKLIPPIFSSFGASVRKSIEKMDLMSHRLKAELDLIKYALHKPSIKTAADGF